MHHHAKRAKVDFRPSTATRAIPDLKQYQAGYSGQEPYKPGGKLVGIYQYKLAVNTIYALVVITSAQADLSVYVVTIQALLLRSLHLRLRRHEV